MGLKDFNIQREAELGAQLASKQIALIQEQLPEALRPVVAQIYKIGFCDGVTRMLKEVVRA